MHTIFEAIEDGNILLVQALVAENPSVIQLFLDEEIHDQALHIAARQNQTAIIKFLFDAGASINQKGHHGWTALHAAAFEGNLEAVQTLIELEIDINDQDDYGCTALFYAVRGNEPTHNRIVTYLVQHQASIDLNSAVCLGNIQIIYRIIEENPEAIRQSVLPNDLLYDLVEVASQVMYNYDLLLSREAREEIVSDRYAPLLELLILHGASINEPGTSGTTALAHAQSLQIPVLVHALLKHGAKT